MAETVSEPNDCECPKCGRIHRDLRAGRPPLAIAGPDVLHRMETYAERFEKIGKPQHGEVIRSWVAELWNRRPPDPAVAELVEALRRALPSVQSDAEMMDAIDRHNPLPAADMPAVTKAANELDVLVDDIRALLAKHASPRDAT